MDVNNVFVKKQWNWMLWTGFLVVLAGLLSYIPIFALIPATRDFPWVNLSLFAVGLFFLGAGLGRAYRQPSVYRGKIFGPVLMAISALGIGLFCFGMFYIARQLPPAQNAIQVGQKAPSFSLVDQHGKVATLDQALDVLPGNKQGGKPRAILLIFYRGHW